MSYPRISILKDWKIICLWTTKYGVNLRLCTQKKEKKLQILWHDLINSFLPILLYIFYFCSLISFPPNMYPFFYKIFLNINKLHYKWEDLPKKLHAYERTPTSSFILFFFPCKWLSYCFSRVVKILVYYYPLSH